MIDTNKEARSALRARQGEGARYDAPAAPARDLDWARRGTAYFARILGNISDAELAGPSAREGLSRRYLIGFVGLQARLFAETVAWARADGQGELPFPLEIPPEQLALAVTLPEQALRYLVYHAAVHLDVEWRDTVDDDWEKRVADSCNRAFDLRMSPRARALTLWRLAIDLDAGGRIVDAPSDLRTSLSDPRVPMLGWSENESISSDGVIPARRSQR